MSYFVSIYFYVCNLQTHCTQSTLTRQYPGRKLKRHASQTMDIYGQLTATLNSGMCIIL